VSPSTLAHGLAARAERHGGRHAVSFTTGDGRWSPLTYAELWRRSVAAAGMLHRMRRGSGPQFVLIALPNGPEYVVAFYACLIAGAVAVPFLPPSTGAFRNRLTRVVRDCRPSVIILPAAAVEDIRAALPADTVPVAAEDLPRSAAGPDRIDARPGDLALLQYTSGSTTAPKGVMVSHANLVHNATSMVRAMGSAEDTSAAIWLPLFHDLGLIAGLVQATWAGMSTYLTTPAAFIRHPLLWLDMISQTRSRLTLAPNFAYDLCVRWVTEEQRATLDLSSLRCAINAAEPVRLTTIESFAKAFQRCGYDPAAMTPAYGMAENTVAISISDWRREPTLVEVSTARLRGDGVAVPPRAEPATVLVSCGPDIAADTETVIVDPNRCTPCPDGTVGEIWTTGPSVAQGYLGQAQASADTFAAGLDRDGRCFLRTGDLGVRLDGDIYVVGRVKDVIIQYGVNHYPQDIEYTAEKAHPWVRPGGAAAFAVGDGSGAVVVCEPARYGPPADLASVVRAVRDAVVEDHGIEVAGVALVRKGQVPRTTSGKVRRRACAQRWVAGQFEVLAAWPPVRTDLLHTVQSILAGIVVDVAGPPDQAFAPHRRLRDYALGSLQVLQLHAYLEEKLGIPIDKAALFACPTIANLVDHLGATVSGR
jgi:acyl-CoA synthetase (AMP-forming)/AMP-acid ligase II/acyl carrier protein